ncbi:PhzF family phenazine biosynthesis protein [Bifidobacterium sp.]|jgi:PhzF family phenazine biosynthesis protein|uniref:PhzF family phenazine biosynthesis protein n=1 Tax=Bifidobacterium sp. TaxID=41200 RepID=UPI0025C58E58|nr:PhzF family phenazine biosynthesis protein [Bifidobacterium sp.]MCH4209983.1 PhzF family phenazine biosynthesis protein [Bifidobacterium sp.]
MKRMHPFVQVDVFSATPYMGNPLAVVLDADDVSDTEMALVARWTNLSETTFILSPSNPRADYRVRIFTPAGEIPFAGHPTLGSAHAWLDNGGVPHAQGRIIQECGAGLVELRQEDGLLSFAAPPTLHSGPVEPEYLDRVTAALGVGTERVVDSQWVDNGPGWMAVMLDSAQTVLSLDPDFTGLPHAMVGVVGPYAEGSRRRFELRAFAPGVHVAEDPVTGSLNASVAQWLIGTGKAPRHYLAAQGTRLGRSGEIVIDSDEDHVWVGGASTICFKGTAAI